MTSRKKAASRKSAYRQQLHQAVIAHLRTWFVNSDDGWFQIGSDLSQRYPWERLGIKPEVFEEAIAELVEAGEVMIEWDRIYGPIARRVAVIQNQRADDGANT